mmetsp:Transcript_49131/g.117015  ORF Transcript_49131/g.117015 Transcript_49131/m.117015 type:complete len:258 (+) Transcript_49131:68-841(+)
MAEQLNLRVLPPNPKIGNGEAIDIEVSSGSTGKALRQLIAQSFKIDEEAYVLSFQNGSRNAAKLSIDLDGTLESSGVLDQATITVKSVELDVSKENSQLRTSISKNGTSSYYYAHANEKELPQELRYVYGGEPMKLSAEEAPETTAPQIVSIGITKYSWADEGDFVCIYISAESEPAAIAAARDGKNQELQVDFSSKSVTAMVREDDHKRYVFTINDLDGEISGEESKWRVSAGKRITLKMKKKNSRTWTRLYRPPS